MAISGFQAALRACLAEFDEDAVRDWEGGGHLPPSVLAALGRHGVFRNRWRDGADGGAAHVVAMAEETAGVSSGLALAAMGHCEVFCGALQWLAETDGQRALREAALDGTVVGCLASTEPSGGSDLSAIRTTACRSGAGAGWRVQGRKRYVSNLGGATHALVLARLRDRLDARDLSLFVVPLGEPGATVEGFFPAVGLAACDVGEVSLDVVLPEDALLGSSGMGLAYLSRLLQFERLSICAQLLTGARAALGLATAFARRRMVGADRLLDKQAVRHRLGRCRSELWMLEAALADLVRRTRSGEGVGHRTAALKLEASRIVEHVTDECLQVFGARGYTRHYPLERIWRDVRLARIGGGSEEVLTELVASRLDRPQPEWERRLDDLAALDNPVPAATIVPA
jgi:alkylation response protein AidB-like acyl-CoA dehydrogenase